MLTFLNRTFLIKLKIQYTVYILISHTCIYLYNNKLYILMNLCISSQNYNNKMKNLIKNNFFYYLVTNKIIIYYSCYI